jgi:hypothetical protein
MGVGVDLVAKNRLCATGRFLGFSGEESGAAGGVAATFAYEEEDASPVAFSLPLGFLGGSGWMSLEASLL